MSPDTIPQIDAAEARRLAEAGDVVILDVREPKEWAGGHAPGALHIPLGTLSANRPPEGRRIVTVCRSGGRSGHAAAALLEWGYDALNLDGGMVAWAEAGLPVVHDDGTEGTIV